VPTPWRRTGRQKPGGVGYGETLRGTLPRSKTPTHVRMHFAREPGDPIGLCDRKIGRSVFGRSKRLEPMMKRPIGKSDRPEVPVKVAEQRPNENGRGGRWREGVRTQGESARRQHTPDSGPGTVGAQARPSSGYGQVAKEDKKTAVQRASAPCVRHRSTALGRILRSSEKPPQGWDGEDLGALSGGSLESNLQDLSLRLKRGAYRARPGCVEPSYRRDGGETPVGGTCAGG